jgi:DNA-binding transcriptional LysR family regulator
MELRHLRYFLAVAESLNFSRAAEKLHIAQPPLSQQIQQLEAELGFQLFHRTKRRVQLTAAGESFQREVQQLFQQLEQAIERGQQASRGEVGQLAIGFVSSAAYNVLPPILQRFRQAVPGVVLELQELTTNQQLQLLRQGKIDVGFVRPPVDQLVDQISGEMKLGIQSKIIFQEPLIVALSTAHPLAQQSTVEVRSLQFEPFILFPRHLAPGLHDPIISLCQQAGFSPQVVQEAIQMQTIVSLVAAEMGVAIVPSSLQNLQRRGVVYKPFSDPVPTVEIALIWQSSTSPSVEKFLQNCLATCIELEAIYKG